MPVSGANKSAHVVSKAGNLMSRAGQLDGRDMRYPLGALDVRMTVMVMGAVRSDLRVPLSCTCCLRGRWCAGLGDLAGLFSSAAAWRG
jgi:hypothetical protein